MALGIDNSVSNSEKQLLLQQLQQQSEEIRAVPIVAAELAAARAATAQKLRELGVTLKELAAVMGVGIARAGQIAHPIIDQEVSA